MANVSSLRAADWKLSEVATSDRRWTGIAVSPEGRIFVNFPRWGGPHPFSVGVLGKDGKVTPFPSMELNSWAPGQSPEEKFVCVQSVVFDKAGTLWILDPASPEFRGVIPGGAKLIQMDPATGKTLRTLRFDEVAAPKASYLNDLRFHPTQPLAFLTDSGVGALLVLDLESGKVIRRWENHPSLKAENITLTVGGNPWLMNGQAPQIHSDGLTLDPQGEWLYYQALSGRTLYRVPTALLADPKVSDKQLAAAVEKIGESGASDGLETLPDGTIVLSSLEHDAVRGWKDGKLEVLATSPHLSWPDSFAFGPDGALYVTSARIQEGDQPTEPFRIFKLQKE